MQQTPALDEKALALMTSLGPKRAGATETRWADPWAATQTDRQAMITGQLITDDINADPEQVKRLRRSRQQAQDRQLYRRDGTPLPSPAKPDPSSCE